MLHSDVQMSRRPWMAKSDHQTRLGFPYVQKKPGDVLLSQEGERGYSESTAFARANAVSVQASGRSLSEAKDPTHKTRVRKLPRQVDHSKVEVLALARTSAGVSPPKPSWSSSWQYSAKILYL